MKRLSLVHKKTPNNQASKLLEKVCNFHS